MTYDSAMQWFVPLFVCLVGLACLCAAERLLQQAIAARRHNAEVVRLFVEAMGLMKIGAHAEAEECMQRAVKVSEEKV